VPNSAQAIAPVLALDGPSGAGKGTVGTRCAEQLGWHYLDSGAIYRAVAWQAIAAEVAADDDEGLRSICDSLHFKSVPNPGDVVDIFVNNQNITRDVRREEVGVHASRFAARPVVRECLLALQRRSREWPGLVADGRDMGTVVFADAITKVFVTASAEVRAERRYKQLKEKGLDGNLRALLEAIKERDARDSGRAVSPLKPADDATVLDTSNMSIDEVVSTVLDLVNQHLHPIRPDRNK
jgi:CMP/dCMP kinase